MKYFILVIFLFCLLPGVGFAAEFDCVNPPFGKNIEEYQGFVKYKEAEELSYYTHSDSSMCRLPANKYGTPKIAYAAIDGKLYAQIVSVVSKELTNGIKERIALYEAGKIDAAALSPGFRDQVQSNVRPKLKKGDGSAELIWNFPKRELRAKFKVDFTTNTVKFNYYYIPLWETLQGK